MARFDPIIVPAEVQVTINPDYGVTALNEAYRERAHLVAHLAALYPSCLVPATATDWAIVYIVLPGDEQASWHISATDLHLFSHVTPTTELSVNIWDGHTTGEKYERLDRATQQMFPRFINQSWENR